MAFLRTNYQHAAETNCFLHCGRPKHNLVYARLYYWGISGKIENKLCQQEVLNAQCVLQDNGNKSSDIFNLEGRMEVYSFFSKLAAQLQLGEITGNAVRVYGGFMHTMYKLATANGMFAVKRLNSNVMKHPEEQNLLLWQIRFANRICSVDSI